MIMFSFNLIDLSGKLINDELFSISEVSKWVIDLDHRGII